MKFRTTQPFIGFGKVAEVGDIVELTEDQAEALNDNVAEYEIKVNRPVKERKTAKKSLPSARQARALRRKTARK
mgnify:CR=1 FL=1